MLTLPQKTKLAPGNVSAGKNEAVAVSGALVLVSVPARGSHKVFYEPVFLRTADGQIQARIRSFVAGFGPMFVDRLFPNAESLQRSAWGRRFGQERVRWGLGVPVFAVEKARRLPEEEPEYEYAGLWTWVEKGLVTQRVVCDSDGEELMDRPTPGPMKVQRWQFPGWAKFWRWSVNEAKKLYSKPLLKFPWSLTAFETGGWPEGMELSIVILQPDDSKHPLLRVLGQGPEALGEVRLTSAVPLKTPKDKSSNAGLLKQFLLRHLGGGTWVCLFGDESKPGWQSRFCAMGLEFLNCDLTRVIWRVRPIEKTETAACPCPGPLCMYESLGRDDAGRPKFCCDCCATRARTLSLVKGVSNQFHTSRCSRRPLCDANGWVGAV